MKYELFVDILKKHQTARVKALFFPGSCATERIPSLFAFLIPDIITILCNNINQLCKENEVIAVFGIQPGPPPIESAQPLLLQRVLNKAYPRNHLCLVIQYLITTVDQMPQLTEWNGAKSMIIDFTTGRLMNDDYYISTIEGKEHPKGIIFGAVDENKLDMIWDILKIDNVLDMACLA